MKSSRGTTYGMSLEVPADAIKNDSLNHLVDRVREIAEQCRLDREIQWAEMIARMNA